MDGQCTRVTASGFAIPSAPRWSPYGGGKGAKPHSSPTNTRLTDLSRSRVFLILWVAWRWDVFVEEGYLCAEATSLIMWRPNEPVKSVRAQWPKWWMYWRAMDGTKLQLLAGLVQRISARFSKLKPPGGLANTLILELQACETVLMSPSAVYL
jgi:hypothetical protein